jgi:hypothetical protein
MKPGLCSFPLLLFFSLTCYSQIDKKEWQDAEEFLKSQTYSITESRDLRLLGKEIRQRFKDSATRLKAAYLWVTRNIRYDCEGLKNKNSRWALDSVLKSRKAICAGYVNVFRNLCEAAGLECVDVSGYGRSGFESLLVNRDSFATNHTWNAVRIGGEWKLIDITWASGYTSEDCSSFTFHRNDWYFCADPGRFVWDHFPKDSSWQLLSQPVSWQEFYRYPLLYQGMIENNIEDFYPRSVIIERKTGDTVVFHFKSNRPLNRIVLSSRKQKQLYRMDVPDRTKDGYRYVYRIEQKGSYDLQIDLLLVENSRVLGSYNIHTFTDIVYWVNAL